MLDRCATERHTVRMTYDVKKGFTPEPRGRRPVWPWRSMTVGDYIVVESDAIGRARSSVYAYARRSGRRYAISVQPDGSYHVGRVA